MISATKRSKRNIGKREELSSIYFNALGENLAQKLRKVGRGIFHLIPETCLMLEQKEKFHCSDITTVDAQGRNYPMLCMPVEKLPLWLVSNLDHPYGGCRLPISKV